MLYIPRPRTAHVTGFKLLNHWNKRMQIIIVHHASTIDATVRSMRPMTTMQGMKSSCMFFAWGAAELLMETTFDCLKYNSPRIASTSQ